MTAPPENDAVTISYAGFNRPWATWIADRLERRGLRVSLQRWDPADEESLTDLLADLALSPGRVLIVCSDWYFQMGPRTAAEWNQALRTVLRDHPGHFHAVTVTSGTLPHAVAAISSAELFGLREADAERRLVEHFGLRTRQVRPAPGRAARFPLDRASIQGGVPRRNVRFTGREDALGGIFEFFSAAEPGAGILALHGMPGVGKTQIAAEYIHRYGSQYDLVWWIDGTNTGSYRLQLAYLARQLDLKTGIEYGERLRAVLEALRRGRPTDRWLVVLDNADNPDDFTDILPSGPGHLLITTRNTAWDRHNCQLKRVPVYHRAESISFIRRRAPHFSVDEADTLAEALEDLPIGLDQTAAWLNESGMPINEYLELLREHGPDDELLRTSRDFPTSFPTALALLINGLKDDDPESVDLLRLCTCFAPGRVPIGLLQSIRRHELPERVRGLIGNAVRWNRALARLRQYALVNPTEPAAGTASASEDMPDSVYVHRMVHQTVHHNMSPSDHQVFSAVACAALAAADPRSPGNPALWPRYAEITPHVQPSGALQSTDPAVMDLVLGCLDYLYRAGEHTQGISLATNALTVWTHRLGPDHERVLEVTHHYANLLRLAGDYTTTEQANRKILTHLRTSRGDNDLDYLRAANGLAADLRGLGRYQEGLDLQQHVLDSYLRLLGEEHPNTIRAQNNLGVSLRLVGRYEDALNQFRAATTASTQFLGRLHTVTLNAHQGEAETLRFLGRYRQAEEEQRDNLSAYESLNVESDHLRVLNAELNLGLILMRTGHVQQAGEKLTSVVERAERKFGPNDPSINRYVNSLAFHTRENGDIDEARKLSERVVSAYTARLGSRHPFAVGALGNLALVLRNVGERTQASELAEQALEGMTAVMGAMHPWTLGCAINATALRHQTGELEKAVQLSESTAARATRVLGRTHPLTLSARLCHAADLRAVGDLEQAAAREDSAQSDLAETLGRSHPHTLSARNRVRPYWDFEAMVT